MTFKELKEKLEKIDIPDEAEIQVLTELGVADAVTVSLHVEPENNNRQVITFYTQLGIKAFYEAMREKIHNGKKENNTWNF